MLGRALRKGLVFSATDEGKAILFRSTRTVSGVTVSPSQSMQASAVHAATSLRADTVAMLPIKFVRKGDASRTPEEPEEGRAIWGGRPNPQQTTSSFIASVVLSKLLWGGAYIYPRYDNAGRAMQLWPLDPDRIDVLPIDGQQEGALRFKVDGFKDLDNIPGKPPQLIYIPHLMLPGRFKGLSPIESAAELVGMSLSSQEHAARFLGDGVHMTGVIEAPLGTKRDQAKEMVEGFSQMHAGPKRSGRVGVLVGSTFRPLAIPPNELQFLEQMKYSDAKIASGIYRVPPHMIGDTEKSTSWGTGIEEQSIGFVRHAILPDIKAIEEAFETTLLAGTGIQMRFNVNALLRGATAVRAAYYHDMWNMGVLNADEIRELEDMPPQPDGLGQTYYVPLNTVDASAPPPPASASQKLLEELAREGRA